MRMDIRHGNSYTFFRRRIARVINRAARSVSMRNGMRKRFRSVISERT